MTTKACDICKRCIDYPEMFEILGRKYELCYWCTKKVKKYIRYETERRKHEKSKL